MRQIPTSTSGDIPGGPVYDSDKDYTVVSDSPKNEIISGGDFSENQQKTLEIHIDELPEYKQNPTVIVVKRAYRELSNNNLGLQLNSFGKLNIPGDKFEAVIVVNNPRIIAILSSLYTGTNANEIARDIEDYYYEKGLTLSEFENGFLNKILSDPLSIDRAIDTYRENQATLYILKYLTKQVVRIIEKEITEIQALEEIEAEIDKYTEKILTTEQRKLLVTACDRIIRKKIIVLGIDCSSPEKSFQEIDLGQATNQGCHIAYSRLAQYIDISDMDEFYSQDSLDEIFTLSKEQKPDLLLRPLNLFPVQPPEQLGDSASWEELVSFYTRSILNRETEYKYAYFYPGGDRDPLAYNSGHITVSARAFERNQYPHKNWVEDLSFSKTMLADSELSSYQLLNSDLILVDRHRYESYDGGTHLKSEQSSSPSPRDLIHSRSLYFITRWIKLDERIVSFLNSKPELLELFHEYKVTRSKFFQDQNQERRKLRYLFLSKNGLLRKVTQILLKPGEINDEELQGIGLSVDQRNFIRTSPTILSALKREVEKRNLTTESQIITFVERSLPEFFAKPIEENTIIIGRNITHQEFLNQNHLININFWIHLFKSEQWLISKLTNDIESGKYQHPLSDEIKNFLKELLDFEVNS